MGDVRLWAARDGSGMPNLFRSAVAPKIHAGIYCVPDNGAMVDCGTDSRLAKLACTAVSKRQLREIKSIDLINWTVEYAPEPPTLKEAWKAYRTRELKPLSSYCDPARELVEALQREFPDE